MTGLLHRLAARANGSAWTVHSDARLPFASETWGQSAIETEAPQTAAATPVQSSTAALASPLPTAESGRATEAIAQLRAPNAPRLQQQQRAAGQAPPSQPPNALMAVLVMPHNTSQPHQHPFATDAPLPAQPPDTETRAGVPQPTPGTPASSRPAAARPHTAPTFVQNAPEPLLPPISAHSIAASAGSPIPRMHPGVWADTAQPAAREDTEVHIHIGRIDVTAVHEAPKPRPRARERTQPVSLDAYLAAKHTE